MTEIQRADPALRRRAVVAAAAIAAAGWAAFIGLQGWLAGLRGLDPARMRESLEDAMIWGSWAALLPVAAIAILLWRYGGRVHRAGRYPPPRSRVVRDTRVVHGNEARLRGAAMRVLAVLLGLLCAGTLLAVHRLVVRLHA